VTEPVIIARRKCSTRNWLTFREREILKLRYGVGDGQTCTLEEVGRIFRVTRERVRQIEAKAVRKMLHCPVAQRIEDAMTGDGREAVLDRLFGVLLGWNYAREKAKGKRRAEVTARAIEAVSVAAHDLSLLTEAT